MAGGLEVRSRARRLTALALLAFLVFIPAAFIVARAPAGWQLATERSRSSGSLRIKSNRVTGLYPGAKRKLILTLHNPNSKRSVWIRGVRVRDLGTTKRGCAPVRRNLRIRRQKPRAFRIRPGGTRRVVFVLTMPNTVANACKQAVFHLGYSTRTVLDQRATR
jgi:hypothetical protein